MTDVKRLLAEATPLPWKVWDAWRPGIEGSGDPKGESIVIYGEFGEMEGVNTPENAALIVAAVNHLPDYEAAVDALWGLWDEVCGVPPEECDKPRHGYALTILRRLRDEVPV